MQSRASLAVLAATLLGADLMAGPAVARDIRVYNNSDFAMIQLQAKPARAPAWAQNNLIGKYSLGVGRTSAASRLPDAPCAYDFLATYDDGHKTQRLAVNVCKPGAIEFN
jgi:hypothetical protein